jgi:colanic acid biosynthesis glycosyl transferase WcaI
MAIAMDMVPSESKVIKAMKRVQKNWLSSASKVVVLGRCMKEFVSRTYEIPDQQIEVAPIPANLNMIKPHAKNTSFRAQNGLSGFVVLYAGNFAQYQDFDTLLDAAKLLKHRKDVTFAFVGDGAKREYIGQRIADEQITNVRMLPFVPEEQLCDMLASADVSLVTLERGVEGLAVPSKFYNIMASGRATVAVVNPTSEIAHVMAESNCGVRVDPEDSSSLARAISTLANNPRKRRSNGPQCKDCLRGEVLAGPHCKPVLLSFSRCSRSATVLRQ